MNFIRTLSVLLCCILFLNGCTSLPEIQNMAYATAIGVDYKDGKWNAYAQILNFTNISHNEQSNLGKSVPVWVGKGEGDTLALALTDISRTSQLRLFWGHVKVIVMTENVLKKGVVDVYNAINRYREVRYNIYIYGTKKKLTEILTQKSILNLPPLETVLFTDNQMSSSASNLLPITGNRVIANLNEPGAPGIIPSIDIDANNWTEDTTSKSMFYLSGGYFFSDSKMIGWMSEDDLSGLRWSEARLKRIPLKVSVDGKPVAVILFSSPKMTVQTTEGNGETRFSLKVDAKGYVMELLEDVSMEKLRVQAAEMIETEIRDTFNKAIKLKLDPFHLSESLYRSSPKEFHRLVAAQPFILDENSLEKVKIHISIMNTGKYKGTKN